MSTRATYQFNPRANSHRHRACVYIHYDGYPEGAACYFWAAMRDKERRGCLATQFIRANPLAELTGGHNSHGDTEYRYTVNGAKWEDAEIVAQKELSTGEWRTFFNGTVPAFLEKYANMLEDFDPFKVVKIGYWGELKLNTETARPHLMRTYEHLEIWNKSGAMRPGSGNWDACEREVRALATAFPKLAADIDPAIVDLSAALATA